MKPATAARPGNLRLALLWVLHVLVICALVLLGRSVGEWVVDIINQPVPATDISSEWWQIFRKFVGVLLAGLFVAVCISYVVLVRPGR